MLLVVTAGTIATHRRSELIQDGGSAMVAALVLVTG
jgi:hypothetical protein